MKIYSTLILLCLTLIFHSCKKSETTGGGPSVVGPYPMAAPACIPIRLYIGTDEMTIEYDAHKRPVKMILGGELQTTYIYEPTRIITHYYNSNGEIESSDFSYLNEFGYIIREINQSGTSQDTTFFNYTPDGYLLSKISSYQNNHYKYVDGDLAQVWRMITDFTGTITDSSLTESHTYYNLSSGNFGKFTSWIERIGRPNLHLEKSTTYSFGTNTSSNYFKYDLDNQGNVIKFYQGEKDDYSDCDLAYQLDWKCN